MFFRRGQCARKQSGGGPFWLSLCQQPKKRHSLLLDVWGLCPMTSQRACLTGADLRPAVRRAQHSRPPAHSITINASWLRLASSSQRRAVTRLDQPVLRALKAPGTQKSMGASQAYWNTSYQKEKAFLQRHRPLGAGSQIECSCCLSVDKSLCICGARLSTNL